MGSTLSSEPCKTHFKIPSFAHQHPLTSFVQNKYLCHSNREHISNPICIINGVVSILSHCCLESKILATSSVLHIRYLG